jgi:hypothetical protein
MPSERIDCASGRQKQAELMWFPGPTGRVCLATINNDRADSEDGFRFLGYEVILDRDGIDRLIGALREARDSAYGRDEEQG